jgi:putative phosphotransacetylase
VDRAALVRLVEEEVACRLGAGKKLVPAAVSNRHIHLSEHHCQSLFGGKPLTCLHDLSQPGEFAARETVTLVGPKGVLEGVRVLGPLRQATQVELSRTDSFRLGVTPPVRESGNHEGSVGVAVVGPCGTVWLERGVILARRHIHMTPADAERFGVTDRQVVAVRLGGERSITLGAVLVRVSPHYRLELHVDTDEANAGLIKNGDLVELIRPEQ